MKYPEKSNIAFRKLNSPILLRLYYIFKLPALLFFRVKVITCSTNKAEIFLPFKWSTKNPFKSVYFAAQCAAAELSSGVIALGIIEGFDKTSMLVTGFEGKFIKKATSGIYFTCTEGNKILNAVKLAHQQNEGQTVNIEVIGKLKDDTIVSKFIITWSFKQKPK